jgi:hypothetical protein
VLFLESSYHIGMMFVRSVSLFSCRTRNGCFLAKHRFSSVTELVQQLHDPQCDHRQVLESPSLAQIDPETFADSLWKSVYNRQYERVAMIHKDLHRAPNHVTLSTQSVNLAAMAAVGSLGRILDVHVILQQLKASAPLLASERLLYVLIHSFCCNDELKSAETLLCAWLDRVIKSNAENNSSTSLSILRGLLRSWQSLPAFPEESSLANALSERILLPVEEVDWSRVGSAPIPLHVWATLMRAYASSAQWRRCVLLLEAVEREIASTTMVGGGRGGGKEIPHDVLASTKHFLEPYSLSAQRSLMFHHALSGVSKNKDTELMLQILQRMKQVGVKREFLATVSLLKAFHGASLSLSPSAAGKDLERKCNQLLSMRDKMLRNVLALAEPSGSSGDGYLAAKSLTKEYLHAMCRLDLLDSAEEFLVVLGKYPATSHFPSYSQLVFPLLSAHSHRPNNWQHCMTLFEQIAHRHEEQPNCFHAVCDSLHKSREFDRLGKFVEKYGVTELATGAEFRRQVFRDVLEAEKVRSECLDEELRQFISAHNSRSKR